MLYLSRFIAYVTCHLNHNELSNIFEFYISQIAKTRQPGVYKLWAVIGNDLHSVKLHVPRIFYVNHLKEKETESHSKLIITLQSQKEAYIKVAYSTARKQCPQLVS